MEYSQAIKVLLSYQLDFICVKQHHLYITTTYVARWKNEAGNINNRNHVCYIIFVHERNVGQRANKPNWWKMIIVHILDQITSFKIEETPAILKTFLAMN